MKTQENQKSKNKREDFAFLRNALSFALNNSSPGKSFFFPRLQF
jgi:hypothetical protein